MTDAQTEQADERLPSAGRRRAKRRRSLPGCLAVVVALGAIAAVLYLGVTAGVSWLSDRFGDAEDFAGPGHGSLMFEVQEGDTSTAICRNLKQDGVVASVDACIDAATANPQSAGIQVGFYKLKKEMASDDAIAVLVDPDKLVTNSVTVPEGLRAVDIVDILAKQTDFSKGDFQKVLDNPDQLGLPDYANGNPEGYLFPSTYAFGPNEKPVDMLTDMVDRWRQAADEAHLEDKAQELGYTPEELMTIASLVQAEGRGDDMPKVARVIYNRLEGDETNGLLQIDATINYAAGNALNAVPTTDDTHIDSPYNTYENAGLPPTPIEAPGDDAIKAATSPAEGDWYYYVTVNLKTGETKFAESYDEFLQYKQELRDYCENESAGAC